MEILGVLLGIGSGVGLAIGLVIGLATRLAPFKSGTNDRDADCRTACEQLQIRRTETCTATANTIAARASVDAANAIWVAAIVTAAIALVASIALWAATFLPLVGLLWVAAATAASAAFDLAMTLTAAAFGVLLVKNVDLAIAAGQEAGARRTEQEAVAIILSKCDSNAADECLNRPRPCSD